MFTAALLALSWAGSLPDEKPAKEPERAIRSGKNENIIVVIVSPTPPPKLPGKPMTGPMTINPTLCVALNEKGRLVSYDKPILSDPKDEATELKELATSLFRDRDTARLTVVLRKPEETSFATITVFVDKMSDAVDKKKVLTLYIQADK
ncbi:MAG: hypothetical protein L0241_06795 [Planctomycetia bacterium]|nr:hypothetical protein [Planctomycetia bacterium]